MTLKKKLITYKQFVENKEQPDFNKATLEKIIKNGCDKKS